MLTKIVDGLLVYRLLNNTNLPVDKQQLIKATIYDRKYNHRDIILNRSNSSVFLYTKIY